MYHMKALCTALFLLLLTAVNGQAVRPKAATDLMRQADKLTQQGIPGYVHAETLYDEALAISPEDPELLLKAGLHQLNGPHRHKALDHLLKAQIAGADSRRVHYLTGYALQLNARWEEAIAAYEKHRSIYEAVPTDDPRLAEADRRIAECRNGLRHMARPASVHIENPGHRVNSMYADYAPLEVPNDGMVLFTSRRPGVDGKVNKATGDYYEDIYMVKLMDGQWTQPAALPPPLNTAGNDACSGLSPDGLTLYLFRDAKGNGEILTSTRAANGKWSEPVALNPLVNGKGNEAGAWPTSDGEWLYFTSERPDGYGGLDIYRSPWDPFTKDWGEPENLGAAVNSPYDEDGVFITPDGHTLYFSSRGHDTMGGYDIFRSRLVDGYWSKPENMGWPINGPDDDTFFVPSPDGSMAWFSSVRPGGQGEDDLYRVSFTTQDTSVR